MSLQRIAIGVTAHRRFGRDHNGRAALAHFSRHGRARLDYSDDRHMRGMLE